MPIENDFSRVFGAIKELEERVDQLGISVDDLQQRVWSGGETVSKFDWPPQEPDYKALFESEQLEVKRLQRALSSEVIKREELESVKLYFAALADRYELSAAEKTEQIEQLKALNEEHLKTIAELVAVLAPTGNQGVADCELQDENNQLKSDAQAHEEHLRLVGGVARSATEGITDLITENNQLRFILSILAAVKDDGWIEWHGGRVPPVFDLVDCKLRDGWTWKRINPDRLSWAHNSWGTDIIAYRIAR